MLLLPVNAYAAMTCEQLHEYWKDYKLYADNAGGNDVRAIIYARYVNGVIDGLHLGCNVTGVISGEDAATPAAFKAMLCMPDFSTYTQIHHIVGLHLEQNPKKWANPANTCIYFALMPKVPK